MSGDPSFTGVLGFTGSRKGLTKAQRDAFCQFIKDGYYRVLHHGDCIGADYEAAHIARSEGLKVVAHPPQKTKLRGFAVSDESLPSADYLERDRAIVDTSDELIACPDTFERRKGSGTWYTIDYASRQGKNIAIIWPNGSVSLVVPPEEVEWMGRDSPTL